MRINITIIFKLCLNLVLELNAFLYNTFFNNLYMLCILYSSSVGQSHAGHLVGVKAIDQTFIAQYQLLIAIGNTRE